MWKKSLLELTAMLDTSDSCLAQVGKRIKELRSKAKLSQEALADKASIDRSYLGGIERGEHNVAIKNIIKIASALNVEPYQLLITIKQPMD